MGDGLTFGSSRPRSVPRASASEAPTRWLVRFGYDGRPYGGWARQPTERTIEGEIRRGITRFGLSPRAPDTELAVASRTDRGVSARANALALRSTLEPASLLGGLNGIAPALFFTAATPVGDAFRLRRPIRRTYRYFEPTSFGRPDRVLAAARLLSGEIDVRSFGRGLPSGSPVLRTVSGLRIRHPESAPEIEVVAPSFVWGMVRKIVAALRGVDRGRLSLDRLREAVEGRVRLTLPLAEAEPLVLWEVEYDLPWKYHWSGPTRHQLAFLREERNAWAARGSVTSALAAEVEPRSETETVRP